MARRRFLDTFFIQKINTTAKLLRPNTWQNDKVYCINDNAGCNNGSSYNRYAAPAPRALYMIKNTYPYGRIVHNAYVYNAGNIYQNAMCIRCNTSQFFIQNRMQSPKQNKKHKHTLFAPNRFLSAKKYRLWVCFFGALPIIAHANDVTITAAQYSSAVALLVFFIALSLIVSFLCSVSEAVLLTMTPSYIDTLADTDPKTAAMLHDVKVQNIAKSISAILTLNTVAHTLGSLGAGAQATIVFGSAWFGVFSAMMTLVILIGTEIIPKTLGTAHWRKFALPVAYYVKGINILLMPMIWLTEKISKFLTKDGQTDEFSRHEFLALAKQGADAGQINPLESRIIKNLLALGAVTVETVITPRSVMSAFDENSTVLDVFSAKTGLNFSRFPIYNEEIDEITGFVLKSDLLLAKSNGQNMPIKQYKREIQFVFAKMNILDLLDLMLRQSLHIVIAVGEYGEVRGLVSLEDVLETLLGLEIVDEFDKVADMQALARQITTRRMQKIGAKIEKDSEDAPL